MTDINKNFKVKNGLETPTISVDSTATFTKGVQATTGLAVGGNSLDADGRAKIIYNSTLSATAILGNYSAGTEGPVLLRAFGQNRTGGTSSTGAQPSYLAEGARGTGASPLAPTSAQLVALFGSGGYDGNKWTSDYETTSTNTLLNPGSLFWFASEAWTNALGSGAMTATNVGTGMGITVQPNGFRMDVNSRQRLLQTTWTAGSANTPPVLNIGLGNGANSTPTLTNAAGTVQHTGYGRSDLFIVNGSFNTFGATQSANGVQFTGEISGTTLTVTAMADASQTLSVGQRIYSNASGAWGSILTATTITALGSGTGGTGTYTVSQSQTVASGTLYAGNDNQSYNFGPYNIITGSRRSGASGRRNSLKANDLIGGYIFRGLTADNSTSAGSDVGGMYAYAMENYTGSARGSRLDFVVVNSGTNATSVPLSLSSELSSITTKQFRYLVDGFNVYDSTSIWPMINANTGTTTFYADQFELRDALQTLHLKVNASDPADPTISLRPNDIEVIAVSTVSGITVSENIVPNANHTISLGTANTAEFDQIHYNRTFGSFLNTATITPAAADTAYILPLDTTTTSSNTTLGNTGTVTITKAGHYNVQFSLQLANADNGTDHTFNVWLRKNGSDFGNSNTQFTVIKNGYNVAALNLVEYFAANDTFELMYAVSDTDITIAGIASQASPYVRPATPSAIVTVVPVGA